MRNIVFQMSVDEAKRRHPMSVAISTVNGHLSDLAGLCITGPLDLVRAPLSESDAEHSQSIIISGPHIYMRLNQRLPLTNQ